MEIILFLGTVMFVALCGYVSYTTRSPLFVIVVVSAMIAGIGTPLWHLLYGIAYDPQLSRIGGGFFPTISFFAGWVMVFPALIVFMALRRQIGLYGPLQSWAILGGMLVYFWVIELLGVQTGLWSYDNEIAALGVPFSLYLALLHTFCAAAMLRVMFEYWRVPLEATLQLAPIWVGLQLLTYLIIGAPYFALSYLTDSGIMTSIGFVASLGLLGWGCVIVVNGFVSLQSSFGQTARFVTTPDIENQ
jgi:hypothetical protein